MSLHLSVLLAGSVDEILFAGSSVDGKHSASLISKNSHLDTCALSPCVVGVFLWGLVSLPLMNSRSNNSGPFRSKHFWASVLFSVVPWLLFMSSASCWSAGVGVSGWCVTFGVGGGVWVLSSSLSSLKWYSSLAIRCALRCCVAVSSKSLFRAVLDGMARHVMSVNHVLKFSFFSPSSAS